MKPERFAHYARQEFLTPGEIETLDAVGREVALPAGARVLEVASGKGEAACLLAVRHGWRVFGVDRYQPFVVHAGHKLRDRRLGGRVGVALGDGSRLPVADGVIEGVFCFGGPSIIGWDGLLAETQRVLVPAGWLAISDVVWRKRPVPPAAVFPGHSESSFPLLDGLAARVRAGGFEVLLARTLPQSAWDEYYGPMIEAIADVLRQHPDDPEVQAWARDLWENEPRFWYEGLGREYWGYAVVIARKT